MGTIPSALFGLIEEIHVLKVIRLTELTDNSVSFQLVLSA